MAGSSVIAMPSIADSAKQGGNIFPALMDAVIPGALGKILWVGIVLGNYLCGLACITSTSRMIFALSRDGVQDDRRDLRPRRRPARLDRRATARSGDALAGIAAASAEERVAAQLCLSEVPRRTFLEEPLVPYETDGVTRLILDTHDAAAFAPIASLTVGEFREWLLRYETQAAQLEAAAPGLTPEMVAAVSKIMGDQDLVLAASKRRVGAVSDHYQSYNVEMLEVTGGRFWKPYSELAAGNRADHGDASPAILSRVAVTIASASCRM